MQVREFLKKNPVCPDLWESGWKKNRTHHLALFQMVCNKRILSCLKIWTGANQIFKSSFIWTILGWTGDSWVVQAPFYSFKTALPTYLALYMGYGNYQNFDCHLSRTYVHNIRLSFWCPEICRWFTQLNKKCELMFSNEGSRVNTSSDSHDNWQDADRDKNRGVLTFNTEEMRAMKMMIIEDVWCSLMMIIDNRWQMIDEIW